MSAQQDNPLLNALPPKSDYLTYLTIIEYNLTPENLPVLHQVLQDESLTTNIGWDLVHLLVPFLPASQQCLLDIARLGNPREVILKVTESLRFIEYEAAGTEEEDDGATAASTSSAAPTTASGILAAPVPTATNQFITLISMLTILHTRVKTKFPSRFLSTTLQAILASLSNSVVHREEMILAIVKFIRSVAGTKRPSLPTRRSSGMLSSAGSKAPADAYAGDPEAASSADVSPEEKTMQSRLLQSFITHVVEDYMLNLPSDHPDVPGMAWCSRIMEKLHPDRIIPETKTYATRFADEEPLHRRIDALGQLATIARDLNLTNEELLHAAVTVEQIPAHTGHDEDEPPVSAEDIPLSRLGSLLLFTARQVSNILYDSPGSSKGPPFAIFPDHQELLKNCLSATQQGAGTLGSEPEALIDAVIALGLVTLERDAIGEPGSDEDFNEYLQVTALLSSTCPSSSLRGHAHYLTSTILRSQPDEQVRLSFIRDTLEHCPFENLRVSAVGWIKGETIEANPTPVALHSQDTAAEHTVFATPFPLDSLAAFLFPSLTVQLLNAPIREAWLTFRTNLPFYLASLNLLYLLLCAQHLHDTLSIHDLWTNHDVAGSFLQPLRDASGMFRKGLGNGGGIADEKGDDTLAELNVLDETLERVTAAVKFLNE